MTHCDFKLYGKTLLRCTQCKYTIRSNYGVTHRRICRVVTQTAAEKLGTSKKKPCGGCGGAK